MTQKSSFFICFINAEWKNQFRNDELFIVFSSFENFETAFSRSILLVHYFEAFLIGIHTGPVVAGIVGIKKFAYDIWGDTVNTASRMESSGEIGKVNISETTYELVKDQFNCEYRGEVEAKGKGKLKMYFVIA